MKYTSSPQLNEVNKQRLEEWLIVALESETFCAPHANISYVLPKIALFTDSKVVKLARDGAWYDTGDTIYVGSAQGGDMPFKDRLSILIVMSKFVAPRSARLEQAIKTGISRYLLGECRELADQALIEAEVEPEGIAFTDDKIAFLLGDQWMLPNGEPVNVEEAGWNVCANQLPEAAPDLAMPIPPPAPTAADVEF